VIRRGVFTTAPPVGDYVLSTSGLTWNVDRTSAAGALSRILAGEANKKTARAALLRLADADKAGAWENIGAGSYQLIEPSHPSR
jgi:hypothetical protein